MSERLYTEREVRLRERAAADKAIAWVFAEARRATGDYPRYGIEHVDGRDYAADTYPLPKITRPRVVRVKNLEYRIYEGVVQFRTVADCGCYESGDWQTSTRSTDEIVVLAELVQHPLEEVEE